MKEWTREEKYKSIGEAQELLPLHEKAAASAWYPRYHIGPVCGLLNDPNGFSRLGGSWHLFYQWCPWGAVHGMKHWYRVFSEDLVHWENRGLAIRPDREFDNKGIYSGTALPCGDSLSLYYTGNHRTERWERIPYTCYAKTGAQGAVEKASAPLFAPEKGYTEHQRDPKILKKDGFYYIVLGAQNESKQGRILVYRSEYPDRDWKFIGELRVPGYEDFGDMWECPSLERLGEKDLLIFCPQHLLLPGRGNTVHHNVCLVGRMDWDTLTFLPEGPYQILDYGFEFYAAQCAAESDPAPDELTLIAWMGLPDAAYPSDEEEWSGCLTLPRKLALRGGQLMQTPPKALETLREAQIELQGTEAVLPPACELELEPNGPLSLSLFAKADGSGGIRLCFDPADKTLTLDRSAMKNRFETAMGEARSVALPGGLSKLRIFVDASSLEVFVNSGEAVLTTRIFPEEDERHLFLSKPAPARLWPLSDAVSSEFIL